jgi:putative membrane protein
MDSESSNLKKQLDNLSRTQFDKAYMHAMVKDHTKDVQEFKQEASNGKDPDVKNLAKQTLPTFEDHLKMAQQIDQKEMQSASR